MLRKLFPGGFDNSPYNSFKLVLISEGYLAAETAGFIGDCVDLVEALFNTAPFGLTRAHPGWLSVYAGFTSSAQSGPAINAPAAPSRTAFESSLTTTTSTLTLNQTKVNAWVAAETLLVDGVDTPLAEFCATGGPSFGRSGTLLVFLLPPVVGQPSGGEFESIPGPVDVHCIAVSKDGRYQQTVARTVAAYLGLADEFELAGAAYLAPPPADFARVLFSYNLQMFDISPPSPIDTSSKWYPLSGVADRMSPSGVHAKADPATPDLTLDAPPARQVRVEFWEGGAGYRTRVWRSAHDCLMRRRIGDPALPVRSGGVPFCPACRHYLRGIIE
jgi:hypothetical protein